MKIEALVMFIGLAVALAVGVIAGMFEGAGGALAGWWAIGLLPVVWTVLYVIERVTGRGIWQYSAPYPYRGMEGAPVTKGSPLD